MSDLNFQQFSTVQSGAQLPPVTMAAATTIAPSTALTVLSGSTAVTTITPPVTGFHVLFLQWSGATPSQLLTTGNIAIGSTTIAQNVPVALLYNPLTAKYYLLRGTAA